MSEMAERTVTGLWFASILLGTLLLPPVFFPLLLVSIGLFIALIELPSLAPVRSPHYWALLIFYLALPFWGMAWLNFQVHGQAYLVALFLIAFAHDSLALLFGKHFGKHKLAPTLSPGKTWEGFFGGFFGVFMILLLYQSQNCLPITDPGSACLAAGMLTLIATSGDLFESFLKRRVSVKNSSFILPGHGGLLDRLDSIIFLSPLFILLFVFKSSDSILLKTFNFK